MNDPSNPDSPPIDAPGQSAEWLPGWELVALFLGDLSTLILFGVWGQASHDLLRSSTSPFRAVINTAAPFLLAWLITAIPIGTYKGTALYPLTRVIWRTGLAGLLAGPLGVAFWALARDHWPVPVFYLVTTGISTSMLLVWRVVWSRIRRSWWPELP